MLNRHVLYLSNEQLCAWRWRRGRLAGGDCFNADGAGIDAFHDYMERHTDMPVYLLADLIEEDFQRLQLPHVGGRAGAQLLQRRLLQQYRDTPFRHHEIQGREAGGRRDDTVLLSALTNPGVVQPWLDALEQLRVPLAGLYSTTLLSEQLVRKLGWREPHLLLLSQQSAGWRQSYFQQGQLKFSRLTPAIDRDGNPVSIDSETAKTQQFLTSVRLMARGNVLETVVIAAAGQLPALAEQCNEGPETAFRFVPLDQVARQLRVVLPDDGPTANLADTMWLGLLARSRPASHYTLGPSQRYFQLWRARVSLYAASATLATVAFCAIGVNLWQASTAKTETARLNAEARTFDQRYNAVMAAMPPRLTSTANMRAAINVERMLALQGPTPWPMVAMVSQALELSPQIRLLQLDWKVDLPSAGAGAPARPVVGIVGGGTTNVAPMSSLLAGIPVRPPQALLLEAEILADEDDYRQAVNTMQAFAQQLASNPRLLVQVDKPPLDTRPSVRLQGKAGAQAVAAHPKFTLNLVWKP